MGCLKFFNGKQFFFSLSLVLLTLIFTPPLLLAANYSFNVGTGTKFTTTSSLNAADIGTNNITVAQGDTLTWTWLEGNHTVTSSTGTAQGACSSGDSFQTPTGASGDTFSKTFNNLTPTGNPCKFYCSIHAGAGSTAGMIGFITVVVPPPPTLTVTLSGSGSGSVASSPAGIDCGATCSSQFTSGTSVTLTATAASGSNFAGFSGDCVSSSTTCTVTITANLAVTAKFVSASGGGSGDFETTGLFDSDSVPDLVVASNATHKISIYPMTSGGSFVGGNPPTPSFRMTETDTLMGLSSGSINSNSDSNDDIVLLEADVNGTTYLNIYYGNRATGTFPVDLITGKGIPSKQLVVTKTTGTGSESLTSVEVRDVNGDGKGDLIVTIAPATAGSDPTPRILLGNGDGTFSGMTQYFPGPVLTSVVVTPASAAIVVGQPQQFAATPLDQYGAVMTGVVFTWGSSNPAVCSVGTGGLAQGVSIGGPITITATGTDGVMTVSGTALCTVSAPTDDVSAVSITSTLSGATLFITNSIKNLGASTISSVDVGFYLSTDNIIGNADDKYIGKRTVSGLAVGASSLTTTSLTPNSIPTGTYYVGMVADYNHKLYETNENNNALLGTASYLIGPDLKVNSLSGSLSGASIFVSDTEINSGSQGAGAFTVSFYLSQGTTPVPTDALIGTRSVADLAVNSTSSATTVFTIPISLAVGSYHLCAITDSTDSVAEINELNNNFCTSTLYVVGPDLRTNGISGSLAGVSIFVTDTQINSGDQPAGAFSVTSYFSLTSPFNTSSPGYAIGSRNLTGLAVGATSSATVSSPVPATAPVANYYLCALSDSGNAVLESNESNNSTCTTNTYLIGPDLRVSSLSVTRSLGNLIVSDTEINSGNQATGGAFTVSYYLSTDNVYGAGDTFLGSRTISGLGGGSATNSGTNTFAIPGGLTVGIYYVIAVSDSGNVIVESNEGNNSLPTAGTFSLP